MAGTKPQGPTVEIVRGDTDPILFEFNNTDGTDLDISTWTLVLTASQEENPANTDNQIIELTATITTGTDGIATFTLNQAQADALPVGEWYYDMQRTIGSAKKTLFFGRFCVFQDIGKS